MAAGNSAVVLDGGTESRQLHCGGYGVSGLGRTGPDNVDVTVGRE